MAAVNIASYVAQYWIHGLITPDMKLSLRKVSRAAGIELFEYCVSLTAWSVALLLVTGLDLTIVGMYRFQEVAYYAVAATIVTFIAGLYNAILSPLVPAAAVLHARSDERGLGKMVVTTTRYGMFLLLLTGLPVVFGAVPLLTLWVGPEYARHARLLVQTLVIANIVRLSATSYVVAMIGSGEQRRVILTPLLEGVTNLILSVVGGYLWGAFGVALGTLVGAFVGIIGNLVYNMPRTIAINFDIREYIVDSLLRPLLCVVPVLTAICLWRLILSAPIAIHIGLLLSAAALTLWMFWTIGLMPAERLSLKMKLRNAVS
jgi:O-antigen/teichoic acid export membrane protein